MSGYNAEYGIPAGDKDEATTPEVEAYRAWDVLQTEDKSTLDHARLIKTIEVMNAQANKSIDADDWRLQHIWESAGEIADRRGYCDVFDSIMDELGTGYKREVEYCVTVTETRTYDVHITAPRGADQRDIEELINDVDLSDWSETDREVEVANYEVSD